METLIPFISLVLLASPTYWFYIRSVGLRKGVITVLLLSIFALCIETIALKTGFPYGEFAYKESLDTSVTGGIPWPVLFAWPPLVIGAAAIANRIATTLWRRILIVVILLVTYDTIFDPLAVKVGFWAFKENGFYYGVPLSNFLGWIFTSFLSAVLFYVINTSSKLSIKSSFTYIFHIALWTLGAFYFQLYIPLFISLFLLVTAIYYRSSRRLG